MPLMLWCILQLLHTWGKAPLIHLSEYYAWTRAGPFTIIQIMLVLLVRFFIHEVIKVNEFSPELFLFKKLLIFSLGDAMWIAIHEMQLRVRNLGVMLDVDMVVYISRWQKRKVLCFLYYKAKKRIKVLDDRKPDFLEFLKSMLVLLVWSV